MAAYKKRPDSEYDGEHFYQLIELSFGAPDGVKVQMCVDS